MADANRVEAGLWAKNEFGITALVLDDAFQHLKIRRDLDIVTIDATNPFGNGKLLPAGILREPLENLKRADVFIITRANLVENVDKTKELIKKYNKFAPIFTASNKTDHLSKIHSPKSIVQNPKYLAFCALGNPNNFFNQLIREKFTIVATERFGDHYFYTQKDVEKLQKKAKENNAEALLTTAKDAVKLKNLHFEMPCFVVESQMIFDNEKKLREIIHAV